MTQLPKLKGTGGGLGGTIGGILGALMADQTDVIRHVQTIFSWLATRNRGDLPEDVFAAYQGVASFFGLIFSYALFIGIAAIGAWVFALIGRTHENQAIDQVAALPPEKGEDDGRTNPRAAIGDEPAEVRANG